MFNKEFRQRLVDAGCPTPDDPLEAAKWMKEQREAEKKAKQAIVDEINGLEDKVVASLVDVDSKKQIAKLVSDGEDPMEWLVKEFIGLAAIVQVQRVKIAFLEGDERKAAKLMESFISKQSLEQLDEATRKEWEAMIGETE